MKQNGDDVEGQAETGLARARRVLVVPLTGLARPRRAQAAGHEAALDGLARKLSFMSETHLAGLVELVLTHAGRVAKGGVPVCPEPGMILAWGYSLQAPPPRQSDYAQSLLRSSAGEAARDGGYMVELLRTAKRMGPPPNRYMISEMATRAEDDRRRRMRIRENIEAGRATPEDRRWLEQYHADAAEAEALMLAGVAYRAASVNNEGSLSSTESGVAA